jgi:hypothetical protein
MFLNLTLASRYTSPIIASGILNPAFAYFPCSRVLHVKCRFLPKDLIHPMHWRRCQPPLQLHNNCSENRTSTSPHNHSRRCEQVCSSSKVLAVAMADNSSVKEWLKRFTRHGRRDSAKSKKDDCFLKYGTVSSSSTSLPLNVLYTDPDMTKRAVGRKCEGLCPPRLRELSSFHLKTTASSAFWTYFYYRYS